MTQIFNYSTVRHASILLYQGTSCLPMESHHERAQIQQVAQRGIQALLQSDAFAHYLNETHSSATRFSLALSQSKINIQLYDTEGNRVGDIISLKFKGQDPLSLFAKNLLDEVSAIYHTPPLPQLREYPLPNLIVPDEQTSDSRSGSAASLGTPPLATQEDQTPPLQQPSINETIPRHTETVETRAPASEQQRMMTDLWLRMSERIERSTGELLAQNAQAMMLMRDAHEQIIRQMGLQIEQLIRQIATLSTPTGSTESNQTLIELLTRQHQTLADLTREMSQRLDRAEANSQSQQAEIAVEVRRFYQAEIDHLRSEITQIHRPLATPPREQTPFNFTPFMESLTRQQDTFLTSIGQIFERSQTTNRNHEQAIERLLTREPRAPAEAPFNVTPFIEAITRQQTALLDSIKQIFERSQVDRETEERNSRERDSAHITMIERLATSITQRLPAEVPREQAPVNLTPLIEAITQQRADFFASFRRSFEHPQENSSPIHRECYEQTIRQMEHSHQESVTLLRSFLAQQSNSQSEQMHHFSQQIETVNDTYQRELTHLHKHITALLARSIPPLELGRRDLFFHGVQANLSPRSPQLSARSTQTAREPNIDENSTPPVVATTPPRRRRAMSTETSAARHNQSASNERALPRETAMQTLQNGIERTTQMLGNLETQTETAPGIDTAQHAKALQQLDTLLASLQYAKETTIKVRNQQKFTKEFLTHFDELEKHQKNLQAAEQQITQAENKLGLSRTPSRQSSPEAFTRSPSQPTPRRLTTKTAEQQKKIDQELIPVKDTCFQNLLKHSQKNSFIQMLIRTSSRPCYASQNQVRDFTNAVHNDVTKKENGTNLVARIQLLKYEQGLFADHPEASFQGKGISRKGDRLLTITSELNELRTKLQNTPHLALKLLSNFILKPEHFTAIKAAAHTQAVMAFLNHSATQKDQQSIQEEYEDAKTLVSVLENLLQGFNRVISLPRANAAARLTPPPAVARPLDLGSSSSEERPRIPDDEEQEDLR